MRIDRHSFVVVACLACAAGSACADDRVESAGAARALLAGAPFDFEQGTPREVVAGTAQVTGAPEAETLVSGLGFPVGLAVDGSGIYWADLGAGTISRAPLAGGAAVVLASDVEPCTIWSVTTDPARIYWVDCGGDDGMMRIRSVPKVGGATATLATRPRAFSVIAQDSLHVYWSEGRHVVRAPKLGGSQLVVGTGASSDRTVSNIVVDATAIYFGESFSAAGFVPGPLSRVSKYWGFGYVIARDVVPDGLVAGAGQLYWNDNRTGEIRAMSGYGGLQRVVSSAERPSFHDLELDATHVYWSASGNLIVPGGVFRAPRTGGPAETLIDVAQVSGIALGGSSVYVATFGADDASPGAILRLPK